MELLERDEPLRSLRAALDRAACGQGACALVHGEAGAGKTSLLRQAVRALPASVQVLWAGCEPLLAPRPLSPFVDLADHWPPTLAAALREGRHYPGLLADLRAALTGPGRPVMLVLDDLHWADAATLDAVRYLARRLAGSTLLLVLAYRDDDTLQGAALRSMLGDLPPADTLPLPVAPLSADAVETLARRAGRPALGVHACTGGNAFFVAEVLSASGTAPTPSVAHAVQARLARLSAQGRAAAELLSASPVPLPRELARRLLDGRDDGLDECCDRGLLRATAQQLGYRHELARLAVLQGQPAHRVLRLHARLFEALRERPGCAVQQLVHHAVHAGLDAEVCVLAPRAAAAAAALSAHREAAALYRRAVEAAVAAGQEPSAAVLEAAAEEARLIGDMAWAQHCTERALARHGLLGDALGTARNLRLLATLRQHRQGQGESARQAIEAAVDVLRALPLDPGTHAELARTRAEQAVLRVAWSDYAGADEAAAEAVALAEALPASPAMQAIQALALRALGSARLFVSDDAAAHAMLDRALALALAAGADDEVALIFTLQQVTSVIWRHHERALALAERGMAWCAARDLDVQRLMLMDNLAWSLLETGRWQEAEAAITECLAHPACTGRLRGSEQYLRARLAARRGEDGASVAAYWQSLDLSAPAQQIGYRRAAVLAACTEAAWLRGDLATAAALAHEGAAAAIAGREARLLGPLLVWLQRLGQPLPGHALAIAPEHALELAGRHAEAAACWQSHGCGYEAALAGLHGDEASLREALAQLQALGARPAADIARRRLQALGVRRVPRGPQPRTRGDPQGLTPRQRQVHALLLQGLSNAGIAARLHRSERTVESHVAQVLAKLGVPTRGALAGGAADAGAARPTPR